MQGNQNRWCGPLMRSNCCCDSHSTTMWVSCKKGSISSAARTRACSPPLLLLLLWDVAGLRGRRQEVEGRGNAAIISESMPSTWKREGCVIGFLHPETRFQKSVFSGAVFSGSVWTVGQNDATRAFSQKSVVVRTRPKLKTSGFIFMAFCSHRSCSSLSHLFSSVLCA